MSLAQSATVLPGMINHDKPFCQNIIVVQYIGVACGMSIESVSSFCFTCYVNRSARVRAPPPGFTAASPSLYPPWRPPVVSAWAVSAEVRGGKKKRSADPMIRVAERLRVGGSWHGEGYVVPRGWNVHGGSSSMSPVGSPRVSGGSRRWISRVRRPSDRARGDSRSVSATLWDKATLWVGVQKRFR